MKNFCSIKMTIYKEKFCIFAKIHFNRVKMRYNLHISEKRHFVSITSMLDIAIHRQNMLSACVSTYYLRIALIIRVLYVVLQEYIVFMPQYILLQIPAINSKGITPILSVELMILSFREDSPIISMTKRVLKNTKAVISKLIRVNIFYLFTHNALFSMRFFRIFATQYSEIK